MPDNTLTEVLTPGGTVTNYDWPPTNYPTDFDPVTRLTECPMWPDGPCPAVGAATAKAMTTAQRTAITPKTGEMIWDTNLNKLYVGDDSTVGGVAV